MAIDKLLTHDTAMAAIGEVLPFSAEETYRIAYPQKCADPTVGFKHNQGYYDASWTFTSDSAFVQMLQEWRIRQIKDGMTQETTKQAIRRAHTSLSEAGLWNYTGGYADQTKDHSLFCDYPGVTTCISFKEALYNAVEHGSDYGRRGPVIVRSKGGANGYWFEIDDPGPGRLPVIMPIPTVDIVQRLKKLGYRWEHDPATYREFLTFPTTQDGHQSRGFGGIVLSLSKSFVNAEPISEGYRTTMVFDKQREPEWWQGLSV